MKQYLSHLQSLPFVRDLAWSVEPHSRGGGRWDAQLTIETPERRYALLVDEKRGVPGNHTVDQLLASPLGQSDGRLLVCPRITSGVAAALRTAGVNYCDASGNLFLSLGDRYIVQVEGRPPTTASSEPTHLRSSGVRVLGALLAEPDLLSQSLRACAAVTGVGHSTVAAVRDLLLAEGHIVQGRDGMRLHRSEALLQRWTRGYWELVRPRLSLGRFALPAGSRRALAQALNGALGEQWAWGGSQAALRTVHTGSAGDTVLHLNVLTNAALNLPLRAAPDGEVQVFALPFASAWRGEAPQCVHPLLALAELGARPQDRYVEVAADLAEHILRSWSTNGPPQK